MKHPYALLTILLSTPCLTPLTLVPPAYAQGSGKIAFDIPSQPLDKSLRDIARQSGVEIVFDAADVRGLEAPAIVGQLTYREALEVALRNFPLSIDFGAHSILIRAGSRAETQNGQAEAVSDALVVTGSRIVGSARASSVITVTAQEMRDAGQYDLGDVMRSIPQNFAGGQNPGVVDGSSRATDQNVNSTSGVNLRGLGPDATLTLLNGKRLAYDATVQSIDISAIPLAAVDRIEILADGASAVYGSDAVAGVANVILKKDFVGLNTAIRVGAATEGGDVEQQVSAVGGRTWQTGGVMVAAEYDRGSPITAGDRAFTKPSPESSTLLPRQRHFSVILTGHQAIGSNIIFELDGLFNRRDSDFATALSSEGDAEYFGIANMSKLTSFAVSPKLTWSFADAWSVSATGTYGEDNTANISAYAEAGERIDTSYSQFDNRIALGEISAVGTLFTLPGGPVKLAIGGGYRRNAMTSTLTVADNETSQLVNAFTESRSATYLYAEGNMPLVSPENAIGGIHRLSLTGAVRYEDHAAIDKIATPKIGLVYSPVSDVTLRASWGKSFKVPTFRQQFLYQRATLYQPSYFSAAGYADGSTILQLSGGNPDLKPERAETWSIGIMLAPRFVPNLLVEASFFHTRYQDRVVIPLAGNAGALTNPNYASFIMQNPSVAEVNAAIANTDLSLQNQSGLPFDAGKVVLILDNRNQNASKQTIKGVDLAISYRIDTKRSGAVQLSALVAYLASRQQFLPNQQNVDLAGTIFNPPHWRARAGAVWHLPEVTLAAYVNHVGSVTDARFAQSETVGSMTTMDMNMRFEPASAFLKGVAVSIGATNLFNDKPSRIKTSADFLLPYDSTNYSAIGRYVGMTIEKSW